MHFRRSAALKINSYYPIHRWMYLLVIACVSVACHTKQSPATSAVACAESLIWADADSAMRVLEQVSCESLPQDEQAYWFLFYQHSAARLGCPISPDTIMPKVVAYFEAHDNKKYLGEALYVQGIEYYQQNQYNEAISCFKQAENYIDAMDSAEPYIGMIYYMQGKIMDEGENLYFTAKDCYLEALPYFQPLPDRRRLACCYRDIARTLDYARDSAAIAYYDTALYIAQADRDTALYMDVLMQRVSYGQSFDSLRLLELCLCDIDSLHSANYAPYVVHYLIPHNNLQEAEKYLSIATKDTALSAVRGEKYHYLHSWLLRKQGRAATAYDELQDVYLRQSANIVEDAKVRTFAISRHYDLEREQEKSLRLTIRQQRMGMAIGGTCALVLLAGIAIVFLVQIQSAKEKQFRQEQASAAVLHEQERLRLEQESEHFRLCAELAQSKLKQRNAVLEAKSLYLHRILVERIELAKHIKQSKPMFVKGIPSWLQAYADRYLFVSDENWQAFLNEFRLAYGDFVPYVKAHNPLLSDSDIQYVILVMLGLNNGDIAFVLGKTPRTIWNRRNTICMRIGITAASLDEWIAQLRDAYIRSWVDIE